MIDYLIMDVDGTLTDGKIYMGTNGEAMKAFSVKDGYVFNYILKPAGIRPIILTARNSNIVKLRCAELGIKDVYQGRTDKLAVINKIINHNSLKCCAYFGDDILDLECMIPIKASGGIVGCPQDASNKVKAIADYICINKAGNGALREFVEWMISPRVDKEKLNERIDIAKRYLYSLDVSKVNFMEKFVVYDWMYYYVEAYEARNRKEDTLKSHREYVDIQIMVSGREIVEIADISRLSVCNEYEREKDVMLWKASTGMTQFTLVPGGHIVLYPETAYRTHISNENVEQVIKIVGRVRIDCT